MRRGTGLTGKSFKATARPSGLIRVKVNEALSHPTRETWLASFASHNGYLPRGLGGVEITR
jgi:hypothetical protein